MVASPWLTVLDQYYARLRANIFDFAYAMGMKGDSAPTDQQTALMAAVQSAAYGQSSNFIACKSGQGPGKTAVSTIIGAWWSFRNPGGMVVLTAPTQRQCREVWLTELRRWLEKADPVLKRLIEVQDTKVVIGGDKKWGVRTVTANKEENAQGYHEPNLAVIVEEASGVPRNIITQFKGTLSNPNSLFLMIGNPNTRDCSFFDCFTSQKKRWTCLTFNAEDTARRYPHIVSMQRNRDIESEFGRESDVYRVRVLGEFPLSDPRCVLSDEEVGEIMHGTGDRRRLIAATAVDASGLPGRQIGIDLARYGGDESVYFVRYGMAILKYAKYAHAEPVDVAEDAMMEQERLRWKDEETLYVPDSSGMGQGVLGLFYNRNKLVYEFHNHSTAYNAMKYGNQISEAWFDFAARVRQKLPSIPVDSTLAKQLTTRQYAINKKGLVVIESKDEYMRRGFDSPDRAEALLMAFYEKASARSKVARRRAG